MLCAGICLILAALNERLKLTDPENLEEVIVVLNRPLYLENRRKSNVRFEISTNNYGCRFLILETEFKVIRNNTRTVSLLLGLKSGDSLSLKIHSKDKVFLHDSHVKIRCREVGIGPVNLVNSFQVNSRIHRFYYWLLIVGITFFSLGLITRIVRKSRTEIE